MVRRFLALGAALPLLCAGCTELDESKLRPRPYNWDEQLLLRVMSPHIPTQPIYWNGDEARPYVLVVCASIGRDDPSPELLRKLASGRIPVVGRSQCIEKGDDDQLFDLRSGKPASYVGVRRIACIDDLLCQVAIDGRYAGTKSWWKREIVGGWKEVPNTTGMTWIS